MKTAYAQATRLSEVYNCLVSERHGIVNGLYELNESSEAPGLHVINAILVNTANFGDGKPPASKAPPQGGSGAHYSRFTALWCALGEAIERYVGMISYEDQFVRATASELEDTAVPIDRFITFSEAQYRQPKFPYFPADRQVVRKWASAIELATGRSQWAPAQAICLSQQLFSPEERLQQGCSTGMACGPTRDGATLSGLCEVVERDAFAVMWQLRISPTEIRLDEETAERLIPNVLDHIRSGPLKITLWALPTDVGIPVVLAMAENVREGNFTIGASCKLDPAAAIDKAVIEALHGYTWARSKLQSAEPLPDAHELSDPQSHLAFYLKPGRRNLVDFLFENKTPMASSELPSNIDSLSGLIGRLCGLGYSPLSVDITTEDVASIGMKVIKSLIPGMQPLLFGANLFSDDQRRLRRMAQYLEMPFSSEYNTAPHPFP